MNLEIDDSPFLVGDLKENRFAQIGQMVSGRKGDADRETTRFRRERELFFGELLFSPRDSRQGWLSEGARKGSVSMKYVVRTGLRDRREIFPLKFEFSGQDFITGGF